MAKYFSTVPVEAEQFKPTKDQLKALSEKKTVSEGGLQVKRNGDTVFGIVHLAGGDAVKVEVGDYLIKEKGSVVAVKSQKEFESAYKAAEESKPVKEKKEAK